MKKQYRIIEECWCKHRIYVYHDGEFIESKSFYYDEVDKEIDKLESNGYAYGFTKEEVEEAKEEIKELQEQYEMMLENIIQKRI